MIDYKNTLLKFLGIVMVTVLIFISLGLAIFFWPFVIAIAVAILLEKIVEYIVKKTKVSRKIVGTVIVLAIFALLVFVVYLLVSKLVREAFSIATDLPTLFDYIKDKYQYIYSQYKPAINSIPQTISDKIYEIGMEFLGTISKYVTKIFNGVWDFVMLIPNLFVYVVITLLSTLFLVTDRRKISMCINDIFPKKFVRKISSIFRETIASLSKYLKSQLIMVCVTFIELLIAFFILKQEYPFTLALIIAIIDALPILGVGCVLIPWGIYSSLIGNLSLGVGLLITYVVILIVRQLVEPKVVSSNLGVHPFITLISMYIGFKLFNIIGLIIGPIIMVIFKNVFTQLFEYGYLKNMIVYKKTK